MRNVKRRGQNVKPRERSVKRHEHLKKRKRGERKHDEQNLPKPNSNDFESVCGRWMTSNDNRRCVNGAASWRF